MSDIISGEKMEFENQVQGEKTLCAASVYERKYYLNPEFVSLPTVIQNELKATVVMFTEENGGIIHLVFNGEGDLVIRVEHRSDDFSYDHIGVEFKVRQLLQEKAELFGQLQTFYHVFIKNDIGL